MSQFDPTEDANANEYRFDPTEDANANEYYYYYDEPYVPKTLNAKVGTQTTEPPLMYAGGIGIVCIVVALVGALTYLRRSRLHQRRDGGPQSIEDGSVSQKSEGRAGRWQQFLIEMNGGNILRSDSGAESSSDSETSTILDSEWEVVFDAYNSMHSAGKFLAKDDESAQVGDEVDPETEQAAAVLSSKLKLKNNRQELIRRCERQSIDIDSFFQRETKLTSHFSFVKGLREMRQLEDGSSSAGSISEDGNEGQVLQLADQDSKLAHLAEA